MRESEKAIIAGVSIEQVAKDEKAVLGSCLIDADAYTMVAGILPSERAFYFHPHRVIWRAMQKINGEGKDIDYLTVVSEVESNGDAKVVKAHDITELISATPTSMHVESYARNVASAYRRIKLAGAIDASAKALHEGESVDIIMGDLDTAMADNTSGDERATDMRAVLVEVIDDLGARQKARDEGYSIGLPTGMGDLDAILRGSRAGELLVFGGRPGMGKTTAALQIARHAAVELGVGTAFYSIEMGRHELGLKHIAAMSGCNYDDLRDGIASEKDWEIILEASNELSQAPMQLLDTADFGPTPSGIRYHAKRLAANLERNGQPPLSLIVVDYLQLMHVAGFRENRTNEIGMISRAMKLLARELGCVVILLSQLSRGLESRADKRPNMSDLRDSGAIEQDADVVFFAYRDDYYEPENPDVANVAEIIVAKNRHGKTGTASFFFDRARGTFKPLARDRHDLEY